VLSEWLNQYLDTGGVDKPIAMPRPFHAARIRVAAHAAYIGRDSLHGYKVAAALQPQFELHHLPEFLKVKDSSVRLTPTQDIRILVREFEG
jgi:hypothetical protein